VTACTRVHRCRLNKARPLSPVSFDASIRPARTSGRDPDTVDKLVLTGTRLDGGLRSREEFRAVVDAYESVGITDLVVHWPRPEPPYAANESILDEIAPNS
jgi:hypothetical protein